MYVDNAFTAIGVRHHNSIVQANMIFLFQFNIKMSSDHHRDSYHNSLVQNQIWKPGASVTNAKSLLAKSF